MMNNKQIFDLTSPPVPDLPTAQELLLYRNDLEKQKVFAVATKKSRKEKNITIKCDFGWRYREVQKHPIEERTQTSSRVDICKFGIYSKKCSWKVEIYWQSTKSWPSCFSTCGASNESASGWEPIWISHCFNSSWCKASPRPVLNVAEEHIWRARDGWNIQCRSWFLKFSLVKE